MNGRQSISWNDQIAGPLALQRSLSKIMVAFLVVLRHSLFSLLGSCQAASYFGTLLSFHC